MNLSLLQVAQWTGAKLVGPGQPNDSAPPTITDISVDSRQLLGPTTLFVALSGPRFDGHDFVAAALESGAGAALVSATFAQDHPDLGPLIAVDDTLVALQTLARCWRAQFDIPLVGITGSNGKTIVKDMLATIMGRCPQDYPAIYKSPGSYNSQVGVALALLGLRDDHRLAIIEAGISQVGEMERLAPMIEPTAGILTNIGLAHVAGLGDRDTTAREKKKLFARCPGPVVVPADEPRLSASLFHVKRIAVTAPDGPATPTAQTPVTVTDLERQGDGHRFVLAMDSGRQIPITLSVPGRHNVANAAFAATMAAHLGASDQAIAQGLAAYSLNEMRLQMHTTGADITLINDTYNADPTSVSAALAVLNRYGKRQRRIAILGDMLDLGRRAPKAHRQVGAQVAQMNLDGLFCVGELATDYAVGARQAGMDGARICCVDDLDALHDRLQDWLKPGDVVLFKASRGIGLERAAQRLLESVAPTRLYVDLEAIAHNFHALRRRLGPATKIMAVVKSFGYGNDANRISQTLVREGVDALAVAFPDEAIPLRDRGIGIPIIVTNARAEEADKLVKYDLQPLVYTARVAQALADQCRRQQRGLSIHLAIDTGMHRDGLSVDRLDDFLDRLARWPSLTIAGVMTHFAAADQAAQDRFTQRQIAQFEAALARLRQRQIDPPLVHAANTAAAWRFPQARYDMVRVGLGLYGLHPSPDVAADADEQVRPALRFTTRVIHTHRVDAGDTVGYGRTWKAKEPRRLATLAAGYNDGFPYFLSNQGEVLINGRRCPVVGSVCMDVTVVDITDAGDVTVGDEALLFGRLPDADADSPDDASGEGTSAGIAIDEWARLGHTISYELLCNISPRVRRIFLR